MADELIYLGDEVKATTLEGGAVKLGGYLVRFGDASQPDLAGDYFTKSTDFGEIGRSVTWFNHRQPVKLKKHNVQGKYTDRLPDATLKMDDVGVFAEVVIEARNEYEKTIAELGMAGKLAWSSGTASHLVDRKSIDKGVWEITRRPLGLDASLTPTPAEPRGTNQIQPIKSLIPSDDAPLCDSRRERLDHLGDHLGTKSAQIFDGFARFGSMRIALAEKLGERSLCLKGADEFHDPGTNPVPRTQITAPAPFGRRVMSTRQPPVHPMAGRRATRRHPRRMSVARGSQPPRGTGCPRDSVTMFGLKPAGYC